MSAELLAERIERTLVLTLSNPGERNALHPDMFAAGIEALDTAERDADLAAIVLTGADRFFCAGGTLLSLRENRAHDPVSRAPGAEPLGEWLGALRSSSKLVIAAVEGAATGAGVALALACDLLVAASDATFAAAFEHDASRPAGGVSWFLARALPRQLALEILLSGKPSAASRLHQLGLVNRLSAPGQARDDALRWAEELGQHASDTLTHAKDLIALAGTRTLDEQLADEARFERGTTP